MKILESMRQYQRKQNFILENNNKEIESGNLSLGYMILILGCCLFLLFSLVSIFVTGHMVLTVSYIVGLFFLCTVSFGFNRIKQHFPSIQIVYGVYSVLVVYATIHSAIIIPDKISVIILCFLICIPIITLDKSWRINLVVTLYAMLYICAVLAFKDASLRVSEILNCIAFATMGMFLGESLRTTRLENFELKRKALIREKTDYLTKLHNRKGFLDHLEEMRQKNNESQLGISVLMIDIDFFKQYNDTYGHQMGDICLQKLGKCLCDFGLEHHVSFARYGGEEFVGVTSVYTNEQVVELCHELNQVVHNMKIPHKLGVNEFITISIGVSKRGNINQFDTLLPQADFALYTAKNRGRNCTVLYNEEDFDQDVFESKHGAVCEL